MTWILRLSVLAAAGFAIAAGARADDEPAPHRRTLTAPTRETLKVGARCVVQMKAIPKGATDSTTVYEGVITRLDNEGGGLAVERRERRVVKVTRPVKKTPLLDRWLGRNVGVAIYPPDVEVGENALLSHRDVDSLKMVVEQPSDEPKPVARPDRGPESSSRGEGSH